MDKSSNEIYALVDEDFLSKFSRNHLQFMKDFYYKYYCVFCHHYTRKPLQQSEFFSNMHRRRIQLYQLCCPYCGTIFILPEDKKIHGTNAPKYCPHCGRTSTIDNMNKQICRFVRINGINRLGIKELQKDHPETESWLLAYDCYQMEIIELTSIIEVVFRDCFEALFYISSMGGTGVYNQYIKKVVDRHHGNDFMNIEKANDIFKKAYDINIRERLDKHIWTDLINIVNLRNMVVHNNGSVDKRFKSTQTYLRLKDRIDDKLLRLEDADITHYLASVINAVTCIANIYLEKYNLQRNAAIANFYYNNDEIDLQDQ